MSWYIVIFAVLLTGNFYGGHVHGQEVRKGLDLQISDLTDMLVKLREMGVQGAEMAKRFVCRLNVTDITQINEKDISKALMLMDKDVNTCKLANESAIIDQLIKIWTKFQTPTINNLMEMVDNTIRLVLKTVNITEMKDYQFIFSLLKLRDMGLTEAEMAKRFVCRLNVSDISKINENDILDALLLMDKDIKTCPLVNESIIVEKLVKIWTKYPTPTIKNLMEMVDNTLRFILKTVNIDDVKNDKILYDLLSNMKIYYDKNPKGSLFKMLGGLLCTMDQIDLSTFSNKTIMDVIGAIKKTGSCSLQQQNAILGRFLKMFTISEWLYPEIILRFYRTDVFKMLIKLFDVPTDEVSKLTAIVGIVKEVRLIHWTMVDFGHRFFCSLLPYNITTVDTKIDKALMNILAEPTCSKEDVAKWISGMVNQVTALILPEVQFTEKEFQININISEAIRIEARNFEETKMVVNYMKKVKDVDSLVELISNTAQNLSEDVTKLLEFMACNINITDIQDIINMDINKSYKLAARLLQPTTCTTPKPNVWLKQLVRYLLKMEYDMMLQLYKLLGYNTGGEYNNIDIVRVLDKLIGVTISSGVNLTNTVDAWMKELSKNGYILNIPTLVRHLICFIEKLDFTATETLIASIGKFGQCPKAESDKMTQRFFKRLDEFQLGEVKEFLIELGVVDGKFNLTSMNNFFKRVINGANDYLAQIWAMVPIELKELTISKAFRAVREEIVVLDKPVMCLAKAMIWPVFGQPEELDPLGCLDKLTFIKPGKGNRPGGKLEDRYKVGIDFPFMAMLEKDATPEEMLWELMYFTREPNTEKEERILDFATKEVFAYLLANPAKLNEAISKDRKRVLQLANKVDRVGQILSKMKMDSESLSMVKKMASPQQAKSLLKKAMKDMNIETASAKKDFIQKIPTAVLMESGTEIIDKLLTDETKKVFIESFKRKKEPKSSQDMEDEDEDEDEDEEEGEALAKLSLVDKLMSTSIDDETMSMMMDSSLISAIPFNMLKKLPSKDVCSMKAETTELKEDQIEYLIASCPEAVEKFAKTNANGLGKLATKVSKNIVNKLNLKELLNLTSEACKYENKFDIDSEKVFKDRYIAANLDPMRNGTNMSCVLKQVKTELPWDKPQAIKICQILGRSILKKIPPKRAEFFKSKCMGLLTDKNITFADMWSMNSFLKKDDLKDLEPKIILEGATILERYVWNMATFNEIGKKISQLPGFQTRSNMTTDHVAQASIFIAAWDDADTIPKASIMQTFGSIAKRVKLLQKKKISCLRKGKDTSQCNAMDSVIAKTVQILLKALPATKSRRKRSTTASCQCSNILNLGVAAVQIPATQMTKMICATGFDECIEGLSQITDWNQDHREVFRVKAVEAWGQPNNWNASHLAIASAVVPGLSTDQIKTLPLDSMDTTFYLGKQNNWKSANLAETFLLFLKNVKNNNISSITSFDLQALGNIGCGISVDHIKLIQNPSYINAASQIGNLEICSQDQYSAWAEKALAVYGTEVNKWGSAEIASIGSVINGFSVKDLQKLNEKQIAAISLKTISKILPAKLASLHPTQIGYLTTSQVMTVTTSQKSSLTEEQRTILNKKVLGFKITDKGNGAGKTVEGISLLKWSLLLIAMNIFTSFLSGF